MGDTAVRLHTQRSGCGGILGQSPDQIFIFGEEVFLATQNSKSQVLTKYSFSGRGELFAKSRIILCKMSQKFSKPKLGPASQRVSHTLRVWIVINEGDTVKHQPGMQIPVISN